jgi:hypothetical protein
MMLLARRKTCAVIVLTPGFCEKDQAGKRAEKKMRQVADDARIIIQE